MAETKRCGYCWRPEGADGRAHNEGCPDYSGSIAEWGAGYRYGFAGNCIEWWRYRYYPPSFILGWRVGKAEIDRLIEGATQQNHSGPEY